MLYHKTSSPDWAKDFHSSIYNSMGSFLCPSLTPPFLFFPSPLLGLPPAPASLRLTQFQLLTLFPQGLQVQKCLFTFWSLWQASFVLFFSRGLFKCHRAQHSLSSVFRCANQALRKSCSFSVIHMKRGDTGKCPTADGLGMTSVRLPASLS